MSSVYFYKYHNFNCGIDGVGFVVNEEIHILSYLDYKNTSHSNENIHYFYKIVFHELIHFIYLKYNDKPLRCLNEGVSLYFAKQYDEVDYSKFTCTLDDLLEERNVDYYNYYLIVKFIFDNYENNEVLNLLKKENAERKLEQIYNRIKEVIS